VLSDNTGFGLVIRYIGLLKLITTSNNSAITNSHTLYDSQQYTLNLLSLLCLHWLSPGDSSQCHRFFIFRVSWLQSLMAGAYLTTNSWPQLPAIDFLAMFDLHWLLLASTHFHLISGCSQGPTYIASARTTQKTPFLILALL
jgi:hypothetical protein